MTIYESLNNLDDIAIQAGTYTELELPCFYSDGEAINLSEVTVYGCTLSLYGEDSTTLENIAGTTKAGTTNTMVIAILSVYTESMSNCLLIYRPYIIEGTKKYKFQGRLFVGSTSPTT